MTDQELMQSTPEEQKLWLGWVHGLPGLEGFSGTGHAANGERIPYGCGPHNIKAFREIVEIVKPQMIFEVGFNLGYSAAMWLELSKANIFTIDISDKEETLVASKLMYDKYGFRFKFLCATTEHLIPMTGFDMAFIDGGHLVDDVVQDINFCKQCGIPWIVMDDWEPRFGPGVQVAAAKFPLEVVKVWGNTCLLKWLKH